METKNIVKTNMEPIDDGGRKYNFIYVICGVIGGIICLCMAIVGIFFCLPLGLAAGWLFKNEILKVQSYKFRDYTFKCDNMLPYPDLMNIIIPELTKMNMTVELNSDGSPMILHNNIIYDFKYNEDMTFSIWWRTTLGRAMFRFDNIKKYRNISADMGIISYVIQKATNSSDATYNDETQNRTVPNDNMGYQAVPPNYSGSYQTDNAHTVQPIQEDEYKFCPNCGTKYKVGIKFCESCGTRVDQT